MSLLTSNDLLAVDHISSGNNSWTGSGFPNPVPFGDSVYIQNSDVITLSANLIVNGKVHVINSASITRDKKNTISDTQGYLYNDGIINNDEEMHVDGYFYNTGTVNIKKLHNDGHICNTNLNELDPRQKFDFHGGEIKCCGTILTDIIKIHKNTGVNFNGKSEANSTCTNFCTTDRVNDPTFEGPITKSEFLNNADQENPIITATVGLCNVAILPVKLISFEAKNYNSEVSLEWITASEINNDYFTIERSINNNDWEIISRIYGAGNSSSPLS